MIFCGAPDAKSSPPDPEAEEGNSQSRRLNAPHDRDAGVASKAAHPVGQLRDGKTYKEGNIRWKTAAMRSAATGRPSSIALRWVTDANAAGEKRASRTPTPSSSAS